MPEPTVIERRQTAAAADLLRIFHGMPRPVPPPTVRDLTLGQLRLLLLLRNGPLSMGAIAETFDLSSTGATGLVGRIERHGFVARQHREDDRRIVECVLTPDGEQFLEGVVGVRLESVRSAVGLLSPRQLARFHRLVRRIIERQEAQA